jgi:hypothetical protein
VLQHFHAGYNVKTGGRFIGKRFYGNLPVIDLLPGFKQVQLRDLQRFVGEIDARYLRAARGHGFSKDAAAAADIENFFSLQRCDAVDMIQPQRVDFVQGAEFALWVPPAVREFAEFFQFGRIDVGVMMVISFSGARCAALSMSVRFATRRFAERRATCSRPAA